MGPPTEAYLAATLRTRHIRLRQKFIINAAGFLRE